MSYEEEYPSLKNVERFHNYDFNFEMLSENSIQKHCKDNQRIREAIQRISEEYSFGKIKDVDEALIIMSKRLKL